MLPFYSLYFFSLSIIVTKSSCSISLFIKPLDILLSTLLSLLLANITILLRFFFLFLVVFNSFFIIPEEIENARLKLALTSPPGPPITVANDAIEVLPVVNQKKQNIY